MKDFARQLTQKCVSMGLLDESYSEWFAYSIEKRVTTLLTWLVQCLIGGFCFGWTLTISFSVFFLLIRKYTNGYHAATYSKCLFHCNRQISRRIKKHLWLSNRSWARDVHSFGILHSWGALAGKSCSAQASSIWLIAGAFRRTQSK